MPTRSPSTPPASSDALPREENLFLSPRGTRPLGGWRGYGRRGRASDVLHDAVLRLMPGNRALDRMAATLPVRRIHIAAVEVPARRDDLRRLLATLALTRHDVTTSVAPVENRGKFDNLNHALRDVDLASLDWLIVTDDDIAVPPHFLDRFIAAAEAADLVAAMPAHRFHSHAAWLVTQRHLASLVRETRYVETGPLTAFRRPMIPHVVPFPVTRWAWGLDLLWSESARQEGWSIGIVDATPVEHLRPVSTSYDSKAAIDEALALVREHGIAPSNHRFLRTVRTVRDLPRRPA